MRANFFGEAPAPNKRNVATSWAFASSALRPPLARFASIMASRRSTRRRVRLNSGSARSFIVVIVIINVIVRGDADGQHLAHRRVGKLIVQPGGDPFCLRDPGDGPSVSSASRRPMATPSSAARAAARRTNGRSTVTPRRLMCSNAQYSRHSASGRGRVRR